MVEDHSDISNAHSVAKADELLGVRGPIPRVNLPLHSDLYDEPGKNIPIMIVDESHKAKNPATQLNAAIRSIKCNCVWLLTRPPMGNAWDDLAGQTALLPGGGPFVSRDHLRKLLGHKDESGVVQHPEGVRNRLFHLFVPLLMVARPKSLLRLRPIHHHVVEVDMTGEWEALFLIQRYVDRARKLLASQQGNRGRKRSVRQAFAMLGKARRLAQNPVLAAYMHEGTDQKDEIDKVTKEAYVIFAKFLEEHRLPSALRMNDLTSQQFTLFQVFAKACRRGQSSIAENPQDLAVPGAENHYNATVWADDGIVEPQDEEDADLQLDEEDADPQPDLVPEPRRSTRKKGKKLQYTELDSDSEVELYVVRKPGRGDPKFTRAWLKQLSQFGNEAVFSSRVTAILKKVLEIRQLFPGEKIIITSLSVMCLDIIKEAIIRRKTEPLLDFSVLEYNGTTSMKERSERIRSFNGPSSTSAHIGVLLMSTTAGGVGVNIAGASHMIVVDPLWNPELTEQIEARAHRLSQTKDVHIWLMKAPLSDIDRYVDKS